jgi:hypothetical protein
MLLVQGWTARGVLLRLHGQPASMTVFGGCDKAPHDTRHHGEQGAAA